MVEFFENGDFSERGGGDSFVVRVDPDDLDRHDLVIEPPFEDASVGPFAQFRKKIDFFRTLHQEQSINYRSDPQPSTSDRVPITSNESRVKSEIINPADLNQMKDRWKICIAATVISVALGLLFLFIGFSFKTISLREYGLLQYDFYRTVDPDQTVRGNGNYMVGIDYSFITYPKGLLSHKFNVEILTKDKSIVNIQGFFVGQLIESEIVKLHFAYGPQQYFAIVARTAQQVFRESIQQFSLFEIISQREGINSYVSSNVCLTIESKYSFINCQYASTGNLSVSATPVVLPPDVSIQNYFKKILASTIEAQRKMNVYANGGFNLIDDVEYLNAQLFSNATNLIVSTVRSYSKQPSQVFAGASYILDNPLMPALKNQIYALSK